jgi:hypothetical protein
VDPPASRGDPPAEASTAVPRIPFPPPPADPNPPLSTAPLASPNPRFAESIQQYETSGTTVWANGYEGELIAGLDGSEYIPYSDRAVEGVQDLLRTRGLYAGPVNGVLDPPTMQAIAEFQEATQTLGVSGIPTPRTRQMLRQGSHTI